MESENNATLIETLSMILAMFQLLICNLHQHFLLYLIKIVIEQLKH